MLSALWAVRDAVVLAKWDGVELFVGALWVALWALVALALWNGVAPVLFGGALAMLCLAELVIGQWSEYGLILMAWAGLAVAVTHGRPTETALVLRVLVSSVYVFGALTKMQPSWLKGENMRYLIATRPQAEILLAALPDAALVGIALVAALLELFIGVGLWMWRLRPMVAVLGVLLHIGLVFLATTDGLPGFLHLVLLNFGLVLLYVSFWMPVPGSHPSSEPDLVS